MLRGRMKTDDDKRTMGIRKWITVSFQYVLFLFLFFNRSLVWREKRKKKKPKIKHRRENNGKKATFERVFGHLKKLTLALMAPVRQNSRSFGTNEKWPSSVLKIDELWTPPYHKNTHKRFQPHNPPYGYFDVGCGVKVAWVGRDTLSMVSFSPPPLSPSLSLSLSLSLLLCLFLIHFMAPLFLLFLSTFLFFLYPLSLSLSLSLPHSFMFILTSI